MAGPDRTYPNTKVGSLQGGEKFWVDSDGYMRIKMTKTTPGSPDGIHIKKYQGGEQYALPEKLAGAFLGMGVAEEVAEVVPEPVKKSSGAAPKNKAVEPKQDDEEYINNGMQEERQKAQMDKNR